MDRSGVFVDRWRTEVSPGGDLASEPVAPDASVFCYAKSDGGDGFIPTRSPIKTPCRSRSAEPILSQSQFFPDEGEPTESHNVEPVRWAAHDDVSDIGELPPTWVTPPKQLRSLVNVPAIDTWYHWEKSRNTHQKLNNGLNDCQMIFHRQENAFKHSATIDFNAVFHIKLGTGTIGHNYCTTAQVGMTESCDLDGSCGTRATFCFVPPVSRL
ncbi:hypothetical protein BJ138DRAFT_531563 [Hygrophoropsis aurantiaca]|uniref:Uncharacterized protein n=1 Tax=Hygrophoropsis aurantiaca TaxID=72124 RepID=A0ACB8A1W4_9AGAM|nr:hypothetical protein BJ138DRAFT_531563 [Hygrophoropsis aurantiaca]